MASTYVTVNKCAPAYLMRVPTVNGNTLYGWEISGRHNRLVFLSDTAEGARTKMDSALKNGVVF